MQKKDFIVRQLEEFGKVMAVILSFKKENDWDKFEKEIAEAAQKFTQLDVRRIESLDPPTFDHEILHHPDLILDQKKILADLLFEKMNFHLEKNDHMAYQHVRANCLALYTHIRANFTENEFDLNVYYKLEYLIQVSDERPEN